MIEDNLTEGDREVGLPLMNTFPLGMLERKRSLCCGEDFLFDRVVMWWILVSSKD